MTVHDRPFCHTPALSSLMNSDPSPPPSTFATEDAGEMAGAAPGIVGKTIAHVVVKKRPGQPRSRATSRAPARLTRRAGGGAAVSGGQVDRAAGVGAGDAGGWAAVAAGRPQPLKYSPITPRAVGIQKPKVHLMRSVLAADSSR